MHAPEGEDAGVVKGGKRQGEGGGRRFLSLN